MKHAIVIGDGITGLCSALSLEKRGWRVTLVGSGESRDVERPLVCSQDVLDWFRTELPDVARKLVTDGAKLISIGDILRSRFANFVASETDDQTRFLCSSQSFLRTSLEARISESSVSSIRGIVTGLLADQNRRQVTGVALGAEKLLADLVIESTGAQATRSRWLSRCELEPDRVRESGPTYRILSRFYRTKSPEPIPFLLVSGRNFRGGIYPLENDRFSISIVSREQTFADVSSSEDFFTKALPSIPDATRILSNIESGSGLQVISGIRNRETSFYSSASGIVGLVPLGESVLSGNPIYGRGVSLAIMQLRGLLSALDRSEDLDLADVRSEVRKGVLLARRFWREGAFADAAEETRLKPLRDAYVSRVISQLSTDPDLTRRFLYNYQLRLPAWRITRPTQIFRALSLNWSRSPLIIEE